MDRLNISSFKAKLRPKDMLSEYHIVPYQMPIKLVDRVYLSTPYQMMVDRVYHQLYQLDRPYQIEHPIKLNLVGYIINKISMLDPIKFHSP